MNNKGLKGFAPEQFIMYLRKSRQDDPNETIEEVLSKHETILQEYMEREHGFRVPESNIFREVCSGESIESRTEIKKVLAKCESANIVAVVVVEPSRLSRGDLIDCGTLVQHLRYTKTLVATPMMTYDLDNKMERKFFQDELMRGNDYLEYTKEVLFRGRVASVKRGNFVGNHAPYGYDRIKIGKDYTLTPNDNAKYVKLMFEWYAVDELTYAEIARRLEALNAPTMKGGAWESSAIRGILVNKHYLGKVFFCTTKETIVIENGQRKTKTLPQDEDKVIIADGKHPAIISQELFDKAQERKDKNAPRCKGLYGQINPFASILFCKKCGYAMRYRAHPKHSDRITCNIFPHCTKSTTAEMVTTSLIRTLEKEHLPMLEHDLKRNKGDDSESHKNLVASIEKQLVELGIQEEKQYELLEKGIYTEDVFEKRNKALQEKRLALKQQLEELRNTAPKTINYQEKVSDLKKAIAGLKNASLSPAAKNKLLKAIIRRIEYACDSDSRKFREYDIKLDIYLRL
jgi:DNA invertase Pin-like site-specific DNA recombinase